jgi:DNA-binding PadR family transcriptional regulator
MDRFFDSLGGPDERVEHLRQHLHEFGPGRHQRGGGRHGGGGGGGRHGGGPFGFGGPGGPFGSAFPWNFLGRRERMKRGDVRAGILALLSEEPRNGYQIMQELEQRSQGSWRPSPGSIYPALQQLEDEGLVSVDAGTGRTFRLTKAGERYVAEHQSELKAPWKALEAEAGGDERIELFGMFRHIGAAAMQVVQTGTPAQIKEAQRILTETRRALYRLLAGDGESEKDAK